MAPAKSVPRIVTRPPPAVRPLRGTTEVTWGERKVYSLAGTVALVPPAVPVVVTVTDTVRPVVTSGVVTVMAVGE